MARILLVRHGESEWNAVGRWQGHADPPLTEAGRKQARAAALALGAVDLVTSSDLVRARHTAELLAEELGVGPVRVEHRLRERDAGEWSGLTRLEVYRDWPGYLADDPVHAERTPDDPPVERRPPNWESDDSLLVRVVAALDQMASDAPDGEMVAVTHGGVIMAVERHLGAPRERVPNLGARWIEWTGPSELRLGPRLALVDPEAETVQADADAV